MLHAILITHGSSKDRLTKAEKLTKTKLIPGPDISILNPNPSITIKQIKALEKFLSIKAIKLKNKIGLLFQAQKLSLPAQHAILKTLEEPPKNSIIILLAPNLNQLLDTIISRCQLIKLPTITSLSPAEQKKQLKLFNTITNSHLSQRINLAANFSTSKSSALDFCNLQLLFLKNNINTHQSHQTIKNIILAIKQLEHNTNSKLTLESLFIHYPKK